MKRKATRRRHEGQTHLGAPATRMSNHEAEMRAKPSHGGKAMRLRWGSSIAARIPQVLARHADRTGLNWKHRLPVVPHTCRPVPRARDGMKRIASIALILSLSKDEGGRRCARLHSPQAGVLRSNRSAGAI
jgi:hypothetical protein